MSKHSPYRDEYHGEYQVLSKQRHNQRRRGDDLDDQQEEYVKTDENRDGKRYLKSREISVEFPAEEIRRILCCRPCACLSNRLNRQTRLCDNFYLLAEFLYTRAVRAATLSLLLSFHLLV